MPDSAEIAALRFLHKDLRGYEHFFRKQKCNEAVEAAFRRVENRLNEIKDVSASSSVKASSGVSLPHELYEEKDLKFPFPMLASGNAPSSSVFVGSSGFSSKIRLGLAG